MRKLLLVCAFFSLASFSAYSVELGLDYPPVVSGQVPVVSGQDSILPFVESPTVQAHTVPTEAPLTGRFISVTGRVELRQPQSILWNRVRPGSMIFEGDQIRTGPRAKAMIGINSNKVYLKPNTRLTFSEGSVSSLTGRYKNIFECPEGKARFEINDIDNLSEFTVRTPTAIAGARGTIFSIIVSAMATEVLVEEGLILLQSTLTNAAQAVVEGRMSVAYQDGQVSQPEDIPFEYEQDLGADTWYPDPDGLSDGQEDGQEDGVVQDVSAEAESTVDEQEENVDTAEADKTSSQDVEKTQYVDQPDADGDGLPDNMDDDDDDDGLLDNFEISQGLDPLNPDTDGDQVEDGHEYAYDSDPLNPDSDGVAPDDYWDEFPMDSDDPAGLGTMNEFRAVRYDEISVIPGLRQEIYQMVNDSSQRQKDWVIDRISDAQRGKVLRDRLGDRVRVEQYIFRPKNNEVMVMNINYRETSLDTYDGYTVLKFSTIFNSSLDGLNGPQIRALPWDNFFDDPAPNYGSIQPSHYPISIHAEVRGNAAGTNIPIFREEKAFTGLQYVSNEWIQNVVTRQVICTDNAGAESSGWLNPATDIVPLANGTNPTGFTYTLGGGINFSFYVLDDSGTRLDVNPANVYFTDFWDFLGVNENSSSPSYVGAGNNVEVHIAGVWVGSGLDFIYIPIEELYWNDRIRWQ